MNILNNKNRFFILIIIPIFIGAACQLPWTNKAMEPIITAVPPVIESVNLSPFQNIGCTWQNDNYAVCPEGSVPKKMGCDTLTTPPDFINFLDDNSQFVKCSYAPELQTTPDDFTAKGLYDSGCSIKVKQRLLGYSEGDYLLIRDLEDLKYYFAPITSGEQALAYAMAATGAEARYDLETLKGYRILTSELQETTIQPVDGGYEVVLFRYQGCGCGPHTTFMETIKVTTTGDIEFVKSTSAFENPEDDDLCID